MSDLFNYEQPKKSARQLANEGMRQAAEHTDAVEPKWGERAFKYFTRYALTHAQFMTEDVRVWAYQNGLPHDASGGKAWGHVAVRACKEGIIKASGTVAPTKHPPAHSCKRDVWQSLIIGGVTTYA